MGYAVRIEETEAFLKRCELSLELARKNGDPAWKIEGLEEAVADARDAAEDFRRLAASGERV